MRIKTKIILSLLALLAFSVFTNGPKLLERIIYEVKNHVNWQTTYTDTIDTDDPPNPNKTIVILMWTKWFGRGVGHSRLTECPNQNCILTQNRSLLNDSHAVVFHTRDINWNDIPKFRRQDQDFVFFNMEPPYRTGGDFDADWKKYYFNATMTYRRDSDVYTPYGFIRNRTSPMRYNLTSLAYKKTKPVAWVASNCHTPVAREFLVEKLKHHIEVDAYGDCGNLHCGGSCWNLFDTQYKFYLSFENSPCIDYITEKFFSHLHRYIVPVVLERRHFTKFIPEYKKPWLIATDDFKNVAQLGKYLKYLHRNTTAYLEYLSWHQHYETSMHVNSEPGYMPRQHWCDLCKFAANRKKKRTVRNVYEWWWNEGACDNSHRFLHDYFWNS